MYLTLSRIFTHLHATPNSRCFIEGEAILNAGHLIVCGVTEKKGDQSLEKWTVKGYCVQSSGIKTNPHEISGVLIINYDCAEVEIEGFVCSCKAGAAGCCKHVSATLLFCNRKPIADLNELSCTDTECQWKIKKTKIEKKYESLPLHMSKCFKIMNQNTEINLTTEQKEKLFEQALSAAPESEFSQHLKGRRQQINNTVNVEVPDYIYKILENAVDSVVLKNLEISTNALRSCCKHVINALGNENILEAMCFAQGTSEWKIRRKNRITGSTCYSIYTFKKENWNIKLDNFFNPRSITTKEMKHGLENEDLAATIFESHNLGYSIKKIGIFISQSYPWLGYSPDGVIFVRGTPQRLLEIKCPYLGKLKSGMEVISTLPYINKQELTLKENHPYYAQIQMGMALLNLKVCDFIIFFAVDQSYLHITVPFRANYAEDLLKTISQKYLDKMIHHICEINNNNVMKVDK